MNYTKNKFFSLLTVLALIIIGMAGEATAQNSLSKIEKQVRKELVTLPFYGVFDNLAFKVDGSTVYLYGQVVRPTTKSGAENRIEDLDGVTEVINQIEVLPLSPYDDRIRLQTLNSIGSRGALYRYFQGVNPSLKIIVNRGRITLEGVVATRGDANLAYIAAREVPGAFAVTNNLMVERENRAR